MPDVVYEVEVCQQGGQCLGGVQLTPDDGLFQYDHMTGNYTWTLLEDVEIYDYATGETLVGKLLADGTTVDVEGDPVVDLGFSVQAGAVDTQFSIGSAKLPFTTIANPIGSASAAYNLTDFGGTIGAATLTGLFDGGGAYLAQYNSGTGFPDGTLFTELINTQIQVAVPFGSQGANGSYDAAIGEAAFDMSSRIEFELSAGDLASGTSTFEITPEPTGLLLLAVGAALIRRRR